MARQMELNRCKQYTDGKRVYFVGHSLEPMYRHEIDNYEVLYHDLDNAVVHRYPGCFNKPSSVIEAYCGQLLWYASIHGWKPC